MDIEFPVSAHIAAEVMRFRSLSYQAFISIAFLCDWKHTLDYSRRLMRSDWFIVEKELINTEFSTVAASSGYFTRTDSGLLRRSKAAPAKSPFPPGTTERLACDHVCGVVATRSDAKIISICRATYPFYFSGQLNLVGIADEYRPIRKIVNDDPTKAA